LWNGQQSFIHGKRLFGGDCYFLKRDGPSGTATTSFYWRLGCVFYSCMQKKEKKCQNPLPPWLSLDHDDMIHTQ
jgi:hypothetical protein